MSELLENMILLCGEPELDGLNDPAARLRALIDGLITQRNRADAAEAEIARLKEALGKCGANFTICTNTSDPKDDYERALREISKRQIIAHEALAARTQPPAVGEDVMRALDLMTEARSRLNGIACGFWSEDQTELSTVMAAEAGIVIDYIDEVASLLRTKDAG